MIYRYVSILLQYIKVDINQIKIFHATFILVKLYTKDPLYFFLWGGVPYVAPETETFHGDIPPPQPGHHDVQPQESLPLGVAAARSCDLCGTKRGPPKRRTDAVG